MALKKCVTSASWNAFCTKQLVANHEEVLDPLKKLILENNFWDTISTLLCIFDSNKPCISSVIPTFLTILHDLETYQCQEAHINNPVFQGIGAKSHKVVTQTINISNDR